MSCVTGKTEYRSRGKAERAIKQLAKRDAIERKRKYALIPFKCIRCMQWHIGHDNGLIGIPPR